MSYQYRCPAAGDCGKTFTLSTKGDHLCPACHTKLELEGDPSKGGLDPRFKALLAALGLIVVGGGAWWIIVGGQSDKSSPTPPASAASAPQLPASAPASTPALGTASAPASTPASGPAAQPAVSTPSAPASAPASRPASSTTLAETANDLVIQAAGKMAAGRLPEAEALLRNALSFDPKQPLIYYNLGIIELKRKNTRGALTQLEAAFKHGFSQFKEMDQDADLDSLRNNPEFKALLAKYRK